MSLNIASGQLASSNTAVATAVQTDVWNLRLYNTSASLPQTVTVQTKRASSISGAVATPTAYTIWQGVIPVSGSAVISNIPVESGDILLAGTTTATNTNYDLTGLGLQPGTLDAKSTGALSSVIYDKNGNTQTIAGSVVPSVQALTASGNTISNSAAITAGNPFAVVLVSSANNAINTTLLPVATIGQQVTIYNLSGAATLGVFPQVSSTIFAGNTNLGTNAIYNIPAGGSRTFTAGTATAWYSELQSSPT